MARGKAAFFGDDDFNVEEQEVQGVQEECTTSTREEYTKHNSNAQEEYIVPIQFGATQGKKGHKAPRINMAFSPENHAWIKTRSKQLGISATELVNSIIDRERMK